jgi:hypothetical protein
MEEERQQTEGMWELRSVDPRKVAVILEEDQDMYER